MPVTTSTEYGRSKIFWPDFQHQGGSTLHQKVVGSFASDYGVTQISNSLPSKWIGSITLADLASQTVTHNFTLALAELKVFIWISNVLQTPAQVSANFTITQSSTAAISIQNTSGSSKTFNVMVVAYPAIAKAGGVVHVEQGTGKGLDTEAAGDLYIGETNAGTIYLGRTGQNIVLQNTAQITKKATLGNASTYLGTSTYHQVYGSIVASRASGSNFLQAAGIEGFRLSANLYSDGTTKAISTTTGATNLLLDRAATSSTTVYQLQTNTTAQTADTAVAGTTTTIHSILASGVQTIGPASSDEALSHIINGSIAIKTAITGFDGTTNNRRYIGNNHSSLLWSNLSGGATTGMLIYAGGYNDGTTNKRSGANLTAARLQVLTRSAATDAAISIQTDPSISHAADSTASFSDVLTITSQGATTIGPSSANVLHKLQGYTDMGGQSAIAATFSPRMSGKSITSLANNGTQTFSTGSQLAGMLMVQDNGANFALFQIRGGVNATVELLDPQSVFSATSGTASSTNIYWNGTAYEIENKTGSSNNYLLWCIAYNGDTGALT